MNAVSPDILRRAQEGNALARQALVAEHGRLVWSLCRRSCAEPEDAYQAAWVRIFEALPRFRPDGPAKLSTWIATLTYRQVVDWKRRQSRGVVVSLPVDLADGGPPVEQQLDQARRAARLEAALDALPPAQRRLLAAHYLGGVRLQALAEAEGVPLGTIKSRLFRAKALLAKQMRRP